LYRICEVFVGIDLEINIGIDLEFNLIEKRKIKKKIKYLLAFKKIF